VCFALPLQIIFKMPPCNVDNFVLPPYADFFADVAGEKVTATSVNKWSRPNGQGKK
jgi:hypothetical protein